MNRLKNSIKIFIRNVTLFLSFLLISSSYPQEVDIIDYLKEIEAGNKEKVLIEYSSLKKSHPADPSVMFLGAVLTENAQDALAVYRDILEKYPSSKYADASLYRIYSYHYALGFYDSAKLYLNRLKLEYPVSPYIKIAERNIPGKNDPLTPKEKTTVITEKTEPEKEIRQPVYKYTIQAGAFSIEANAKNLKKEFEESGYFTEIKEKVVAGTTFHVVYIGRFESEEEAKNFLTRINSEFKLEGRVVSLI